jgi:hypothetical protein
MQWHGIFVGYIQLLQTNQLPSRMPKAISTFHHDRFHCYCMDRTDTIPTARERCLTIPKAFKYSSIACLSRHSAIYGLSTLMSISYLLAIPHENADTQYALAWMLVLQYLWFMSRIMRAFCPSLSRTGLLCNSVIEKPQWPETEVIVPAKTHQYRDSLSLSLLVTCI